MLDIVFASFAIWATCRFSAAATAAAILAASKPANRQGPVSRLALL